MTDFIFGYGAGICSGLILFFIFDKMNLGSLFDTFEFDHVEDLDGYSCILYFKSKTGRQQAYRGSCTVWYTYPGGNRCGTFKEAELSDVWTREVDWKRKKKK